MKVGYFYRVSKKTSDKNIVEIIVQENAILLSKRVLRACLRLQQS